MDELGKKTVKISINKIIKIICVFLLFLSVFALFYCISIENKLSNKRYTGQYETIGFNSKNRKDIVIHNTKELNKYFYDFNTNLNHLSKYDDDFFENNALAFVNSKENYKLYDVYEKGDTVFIKRVQTNYSPLFFMETNYFIPVSKNISKISVTCQDFENYYKFEQIAFYTIVLSIVLLLSTIIISLYKKCKKDEDKKNKRKNETKLVITILLLVSVVFIVIFLLFYFNRDTSVSVDKPIIYMYPTEETNVEVKVGNPEKLTHTYPKYENSWNVIAKPSGDLVDLKTGRNLYALYWEGINTAQPNMNEGFVVKGEDTINFLEEKLRILGLNEREAEEFIVYWLPKLENNKYNFIRFQTEEEINENMPLEINPKPDTVIRIVMEYKELNKRINVTEQELETPIRKGFTVVEWGGTEIK